MYSNVVSRQTLSTEALDQLRGRAAQRLLRQPVAKGLLQLSNLGHHGQRVLSLLLHLRLELDVLLAHTLNLVTKFCKLVRGLTAVAALALGAGSLALVVVGRGDRVTRGRRAVGAGGVHSTKMLVEVLLPREALARVALAVGMRAVDSLLGAAVLAVDFTLVAKQAARVCEAGQVFAAVSLAAVWSLVLIHVLAVGEG